MAEPLCLGKICLSTLQLLGQLLLLSQIYPCSNEAYESLPVSPRNAHAAHATNLSIWPHNPFCEVESAMLDEHLLNCLFHEPSIFCVYEIQIFFYRWRLATRIKAVDLKQFGRPVI